VGVIGVLMSQGEAVLHILLIEDDEVDKMRIQRYIQDGGQAWARIDLSDSLEQGKAKLASNNYDCVLLDLNLPDGNGMDFLRSLQDAPEQSPAIVLQTVADDEALGIQALDLGAQDYLVKGSINGPLLLKTVRFAIQRHGLMREKDRLVTELQEALRNVHTLHGLLPICSACKSIRNDDGYWQQVEEYFARHSKAKFTHGICPTCVQSLYPHMG